MKFQHIPRLLAAALFCVTGMSCSLFKKKDADPYAQDGGYNPYGGQPGQVTSNYQQYQPTTQQPPQYQTYTPPAQDSQPSEEEHTAPAPKKKKSTSSGGGGTAKASGG